MALPTSTIVMAVLTCVPFGLAIRDTVHGTAPAAHGGDDDDDGDGDSQDDNSDDARMEAERAAGEAETERLERAEQAKKEKLRTARRDLFGAEVATLGSGFRGLTLGMPESEIRSETISRLEAAASVDIEPLPNVTLDWLTITAEDCDKLGQDLQEAWGRGKTEDYESRYWQNPTTGTRASFDPATCELTFERFAEPTAWVTKTKTSVVPVWLVGQSIAKLREHIGARSVVEPSEPSVRWLGLGVGTGSGEARFEAFFAHGKVVAVVATADTFESTRDEVVEQLTTLYGPPIADDEGVHWRSRPAIALDDHEGAGIRITAGKVPHE